MSEIHLHLTFDLPIEVELENSADEWDCEIKNLETLDQETTGYIILDF